MGENGGLYTLIGDVSGFEPGDRVELVGTPVEVSICMQGITLDVQAIQAESVKGQQTLIILEGAILASTALPNVFGPVITLYSDTSGGGTVDAIKVDRPSPSYVELGTKGGTERQ